MMPQHSIMVVDDNEDTLAIYGRILTLEGYEVFTAVSGNRCLEQLATARPDIFLMDVVLPDWNGIDLVREIKKRPEFSFAMFVLMSGLITDVDSKIEGLDAGAVDFLARPIPNKELVAKVKSLIKVMDFQESLVTLSNELEQRVNERTRELEKSIQEVVMLERQLQQAQKIESLGRLAGGVAHDFNNLLTVILGNAFLALAELGLSQPLHERLEEIQNAAERAANLTRQLLVFARKQTIEPKVIDLNKTVTEMLRMLYRLIGENIDLTWRPADVLWSVKVDPTQIDQILANLCVNARDAISNVGTITIESGNDSFNEGFCDIHAGFVTGEYVRLAVSDNGCGMDQETLAHIFEPFFTTKGEGEGTGLGLSTVYGAVKQNNGFVTVDSEPGRGTTFTIYLPRHVEYAEQMQAGSTDSDSGGPETILVVEDEPTLLRIAASMLEKLGYTVLRAGSPAKAIDLAREHPRKIHLVLTDVVMPEMNGRDLVQNLLSLQPHLKCLLMSGYTADAVTRYGALDEGICFIQKPFSAPALGAKIREALA